MLLALKNLEVKIDSNSATDEDRESRIKFLHEIDKIDRCDSLDLFQKSHINWDIKGDGNSKFFHGIEKFELHDSSSALPSTSFPSKLTVDDHSLLEKDVTLDEIKSAVWNCVFGPRLWDLLISFIRMVFFLKESIRLFRLEKDKDCYIQDRLKDNQWEWNWSRSFLGVRNTAYLHDMINDISHIELNLDRDVCYWVLSNDDIVRY
ncbi:hypothetical protein Tco_0216678 [Tanacetum coccineum]